MQHLIRFNTQLKYLSASNLEKINDLPKRSIYENDYVLPCITFFDEDAECVWFENELDFIPQIGWSISCDADNFSWDDDTNPIVCCVTYMTKLNLFVIDLDWGLHNQLEIVRDLRNNR